MSFEVIFIALFECLDAFWICDTMFLRNLGEWLWLIIYLSYLLLLLLFLFYVEQQSIPLYFSWQCCGIPMVMHNKKNLHAEWIICLMKNNAKMSNSILAVAVFVHANVYLFALRTIQGNMLHCLSLWPLLYYFAMPRYCLPLLTGGRKGIWHIKDRSKSIGYQVFTSKASLCLHCLCGQCDCHRVVSLCNCVLK